MTRSNYGDQVKKKDQGSMLNSCSLIDEVALFVLCA